MVPTRAYRWFHLVQKIHCAHCGMLDAGRQALWLRHPVFLCKACATRFSRAKRPDCPICATIQEGME